MWFWTFAVVLCLATLEYFMLVMLKSSQMPRSYERASPLWSWFRNKGIWSHFLTISATGSRRQIVLAPKGATPIRGERTSVSLHHYLRNGPKTAGRGQWEVTYTNNRTRNMQSPPKSKTRIHKKYKSLYPSPIPSLPETWKGKAIHFLPTTLGPLHVLKINFQKEKKCRGKIW